MEELTQIYRTYAEQSARILRDAKPLDGLFGFGDDPRKDPCHMRFYEDAERWAKRFLASEPTGEALYEAVRFLLQTPDVYREKSCFWFMYAAQGFARDMIPKLDSIQCSQLRELYDALYPKRDRMPVQTEVYKLLKRGSKRR